MENRKKKNTEKINESQKHGYEDLLKAFSLKDGEDESKKTARKKSLDMDDLALAELLVEMDQKPILSDGEDSTEIVAEEKPNSEKEYERQDDTFFHEDIKETTDTVSSNAAEELKAEDAGQESPKPDFEKPEFIIEDNQNGYASILSELEEETAAEVIPAPALESEPEVDLKQENIADFNSNEIADKDVHDLEDDLKSASNILETSELPSLDEPEGKSAMDASAEPVIPENSIEKPIKQEEPDFLGLSGIPSKPEKPVKQTFSRTDVLFDGVEMDFDEQIDLVTHAELLFSQGKRKEAAEIFHQLSEKKGVTHWVSKRLRLLTVTDN